ncbi:cytochrome c biogenesis CcdA family protein [Streptomyces sp. NPDC058086]|uniref:cytochrome c biogenesis CcdA family protein n=1 Tax=Streptomyces sp. NPDC058086 TaxID=3346334 RepID=UPI0036E5ADBC
MGDLLFGTTLLASFLGGVVALLAPCCVSVMLPAYLATGFRRRTGILAATLIFAAGVATVIVSIGLGATVLVALISGHHLLVFSIGGAAMALGGLALLAGWKPQLPMIAGRAPTGHGFGSVYGLGVFSGAASSCCAPVLDDQSYGLSATLADPRGTRRALKLRGCGTGCFYTPLTWRKGTSHLTLTASAGEEWAGGRAGLAITWPARPDAALLRETVAAMKRAPRLTLHELVTSNTTLGLGDLKQLPITGKEFLAAEPYGSGTAPVITRLPDDIGHRRLALAYPAEHTQLDLTLDETGRIFHETLTAPNHLVTRTFVHPETGEEGHEH